MADDFILPDGSRFDLNVGLGESSQPFSDYAGFLKETKERLLMYGRSPKLVNAIDSISAEVGDDEVSVESTPVYSAAELAVYNRYLGVCISEEDTSINPRFGNFAEDLVIVPDGYEQTYHYAQQTSNFRDMSYLDVPKLRLAIDIRPGRMNHSATNDGKAGMLGSRLAWLPRDSPVRVMWEVFNLFQDINLGLIRDKKFPYLPTALGGYGKPLPFGYAPNMEAILVRYKQGTHRSLCRELIRRTVRRCTEYTIDRKISIDPILSAVSRLQSSWHDWIKGKTLYAPTCWLEAPPEVASYRVAVHGQDVLLDSSLRRLQDSGHLVTESDLAIAYEHNQLCQYLIGTETHEEFLERREKSRFEWKNLSTFSLRLYGYIEKIGVDQSLHHPLSDSEVSEFVTLLRGLRVNLKAFLRQENLYRKEAKDLIYKQGPMMVNVGMFPRMTTMSNRRYWFEQTIDRQYHTDNEEEYIKLLNWVLDKNRPTMPPSRALVEDDPFIIREISLSPEGTAFCIVTDDIQLCRKAWVETRKWVCRIPTKWYYFDLYFGEACKPWEQILRKDFPYYVWSTIEDEGSIRSYEEIGFRDGNPICWPRTRPFLLTQRSIKDGRNRVRIKSTESPIEENYEWSPYRFPDGYLFASRSYLQRRSHPFRRGLA